VYEAAPENSKVLVFNSELSFKEMVKAFINEDIYCALIYDSEKQYFVGLITISDILMLFNYIIEKTQKREITDYNTFIKDIFSSNALKEEKKK
jgi:predicted transcriptional regulator